MLHQAGLLALQPKHPECGSFGRGKSRTGTSVWRAQLSSQTPGTLCPAAEVADQGRKQQNLSAMLVYVLHQHGEGTGAALSSPFWCSIACIQTEQ